MPARKSSTGKDQTRKPTLSPTRIAAYLECAVKYKYIYQDKLSKFYLRARAGYSFGSTLHHVLQQFHEQGETHTPEEMKTRLEENWIGAGYKTAEQEQQQQEAGRQIVQAYHAAYQERAQAAVETFATEKTITCDMGRFKLTGRVDRIDRHQDGRLEIIDYKSGRWETTPEEVANSLAMCCYQLILRRLYPETPVFATIYCLRSGNSASAELAGEAFEEFERELLILGHEILDQEYDHLEPVLMDICAECDFYSRCRRFWRANEQAEHSDSPHSESGL